MKTCRADPNREGKYVFGHRQKSCFNVDLRLREFVFEPSIANFCVLQRAIFFGKFVKLPPQNADFAAQFQ